MDRMVAFEDDVLCMLNLAYEVVATKVHAVTFVLRELRPLFHALEHVIDPRASFTLHACTKRCELIFFAHVLLRPVHGQA